MTKKKDSELFSESLRISQIRKGTGEINNGSNKKKKTINKRQLGDLRNNGIYPTMTGEKGITRVQWRNEEFQFHTAILVDSNKNPIRSY